MISLHFDRYHTAPFLCQNWFHINLTFFDILIQLRYALIGFLIKYEGNSFGWSSDVPNYLCSKLFMPYVTKNCKLVQDNLKVAFFQKVRCVFQISKSQKKIFQKTILSLKFKFPANYSILLLTGNLNFKLRIVFGIFFFEILRCKHIALSEKKPPLKV